MSNDGGHSKAAPEPERLTVSQKLIELIERQYPGTLMRVGDDYDWVLASGQIVRLSVRLGFPKASYVGEPDTEI